MATREPKATPFLKSVEAILSDLQDLRDQWLHFEEQFDGLCSITRDIKGTENELGHDPLCFKTFLFLRKVKRLRALCPINIIERFKLIRAEMETLPLLRPGAWKTGVWNEIPVSVDLAAMQVRLQEMRDLIVGSDNGRAIEDATSVEVIQARSPRGPGRPASIAVPVRNRAISNSAKNFRIDDAAVKTIARAIDAAYRTEAIDPGRDSWLVESCREANTKECSYSALAAVRSQIPRLKEFFSRRRCDAPPEGQS